MRVKTNSRFRFGICLCLTMLLGLLAYLPTPPTHAFSSFGDVSERVRVMATVDQTATSAAATIAAALAATQIPNPNGGIPLADATKTAEAQGSATTAAATLTAQPSATPTPDVAATQTTEVQRLATMVAATLTAQPTPTTTPPPDLVATQTVLAANASTSVAATLTALPSPTATPTPLAASPEQIDVIERLAEIRATDVTFSDDFRRDNGDWYTESDENVTYQYAGRTLHIIVNSENRLGWSFNSAIEGLTPVDYLVEVDVKQVAGPDDAELGLIFRFVDQENFYFFAVSNLGTYSLWKLVDNEWEALIDWTQTNALQINAEAINRLGVLTEGDQITLLVNDVALVQVVDDTFATGTVGLMVGTFDEIGVDVAFDDLDLWVLATAEAIVTTPVVTPISAAAPIDMADRLAEIKATDPITSDDFRQDNGTWNIEPDDDASFFYRGRAFHIKVDAPGWIGWSTGEIVTTNFLLEVDTQYVAGPVDAEYGLIFRQVDADNYYFFAISRSGSYGLWRLEDGAWAVLVEWTAVDAISTDEDAINRLGVLAEGAQLTLLVNDVALTQLEDETFASGKVALALGTFDEAGAEVAFDNLDVWATE